MRVKQKNLVYKEVIKTYTGQEKTIGERNKSVACRVSLGLVPGVEVRPLGFRVTRVLKQLLNSHAVYNSL